jgi:lipopolysaccharide export system permease protein
LTPTRSRLPRPRPSAKLSRYLVSEMVLPALVAVLAFGLVVLMTDLLGYAELIVNRGLGIGAVGRIAALQLVPTLARTLPFAILVGILVGLGRLSADRELLALEASGFSPRQLTRPGLYFALAAMSVSIGLSVFAAPAAQTAVRDEMIRLSEEKPGLALRAGLTSEVGDWRIEARDVEEEGARLGGVLLYMPSLGETIFSQRGAILTDEDSAAKSIILEDGLLLDNGNERSSLLRFERMETQLPELKSAEGVPVDHFSTMPYADLIDGVQNAGDPRVARMMRIEAHRRMALGAAALPFGLLAMGLALGRRNFSRASGTVMGLIGAISYYALIQLSEGMLRDESIPVGPVTWLPDLVLSAVGLTLIFRAGRTASASDRGNGRGGSSFFERAGFASSGPRMKRWALPRYVSGQFVRMVILCVLGLVFAYFIIDVFDNLKWFNRYGATTAEIGRFYAARLPVLAARIVPMALLIAVALTISLIGANGELLGMRACGIPVFRVLAPVWLLCGLAVPADHLLANELVPRASERATYLKRTEIKNQQAAPRQTRERVWYRVGTRIHEMERLDLLRGRASAITLYDLGASGLPERRTDADEAIHIGGGGWLLSNPRSVELEGPGLRRDPDAARFVKFGDEVPTEVDTANLTPGQLRAQIADLNLEGPLEAAYRTALAMKIAAPLSCLLLPLIALFFAATGPPFPRPVHTLIASAIIAVGHALTTSTAGALGQGGTISPWLAGWAPSLLFGSIALFMGIRLRRKLSRAG